MHPEESGTGSLTCNGLTPVVGHAPRLLIPGGFPGKRSLFHAQYYAHPQNQFWQNMESLLGVHRHLPYALRTRELIRYRIALRDVIATCHGGSADHRIKTRYSIL
jgi:TDG/mug DNA glycosylase family protein